MKISLFQNPEEKTKKLLLIFLIILCQWIIYLQIAYDSQAQIWSMANPDSMCTLSVARSWVHGHPLQIIPGDPPSTILADLLSPLFFSIGYWLGFTSPSHFILWAYIECLFIGFLSAYFLWRAFNNFIPKVAFPATA